MLKPQDVVIAIKIALQEDRPWTQMGLAGDLAMSASEINGGIRRGIACRLLARDSTTKVVNVLRNNLLEFVVHGLVYVYPPERGAPARGMPTGVAMERFRSLLTKSTDLPPVWPDPQGTARGFALKPLYPSVPEAARRDPALYEVMALIDALRDGLRPQREDAIRELNAKLAPGPG